jgi:hypothetical protein
MSALNYLGYDPNREIPLVTKIKQDVKKFNDKNQIINRIKELETETYFNMDKKQFIWTDDNDGAENMRRRRTSSFVNFKNTSYKMKHQHHHHHRVSKTSSRSRNRSLSLNNKLVSVFEPSTMKELNDKDKKIDIYDSIDYINKYLEAKKRKSQLDPYLEQHRRSSDSSSSQEKNAKFLAKLVLTETENEEEDDGFGMDYETVLENESYMNNNSSSQQQFIDTIAEEY